MPSSSTDSTLQPSRWGERLLVLVSTGKDHDGARCLRDVESLANLVADFVDLQSALDPALVRSILEAVGVTAASLSC